MLASFNLYVRDARLERFIAAAEDPEIPSSVSLASSGFHPSLEYSTSCASQLDSCSYLPVFTGRTWNRNGMRCRARSVVPGFGSPQNHPSSAGYGDFDLLLADYLHVDDRSILAYQVTSPEHYPLADRSNIQVCLLVALTKKAVPAGLPSSS